MLPNGFGNTCFLRGWRRRMLQNRKLRHCFWIMEVKPWLIGGNNPVLERFAFSLVWTQKTVEMLSLGFLPDHPSIISVPNGPKPEPLQVSQWTCCEQSPYLHHKLLQLPLLLCDGRTEAHFWQVLVYRRWRTGDRSFPCLLLTLCHPVTPYAILTPMAD